MIKNNFFNYYSYSDLDVTTKVANAFYDYKNTSTDDKIVYATTGIHDYIREKYVSNQSSSTLAKSKIFQQKKMGSRNDNIYETATEFKHAVVENFQKSIAQEDLEFGVKGNTAKLIESFLAINKDYTVNAITQLALDHFKNIDLVYSVLHTLAHINYNLISPGGATFALSASQHENIEIQDFSIQCFDMWASQESLGYLKVIKISTPWLNNYLQEVIRNIESTNV